MMVAGIDDEETLILLQQYVACLKLPTANLKVTTERRTFAGWLGRPIRSSLGGAYVYLPGPGIHAILINLPRIDRAKRHALEIVVAEELLHMRDFLDGDRRRHAKHGYDRIAHRVSALTGSSLEEVRSCLIPVERRPPRYLYGCRHCGLRVARRVRGNWSCARCAPAYDPRYRLVLVDDAASMEANRQAIWMARTFDL